MVDKKARQDFEAFAKGVKRLKELEKELNSLNTKNFKSEERDIRAKLKSVHLIPQIERDINELKAKIAGVDVKALKEELDFEQNKKLELLERRSEELERQLAIARKGLLTEKEIRDLSTLAEVPDKVSYLKSLLNSDNQFLKEEIQKIGRRKQLTDKEVKDVNSIPGLKGKVSYLKRLLAVEEEKIKKIGRLEPKLNKGLSRLANLSRKLSGLSKEESAVLDLLGEEYSEIESLKEKSKKLPGFSQKISKLSEKDRAILQLIEKERAKIENLNKETEKLPSLSGKISALSKAEHAVMDMLGMERTELEKIEKRTGKIPWMSGKLSALSKNLDEKSQEISKETAEIDALKHKLSYLKKILEQKTAELQKEVKKAADTSAKKKLSEEVKELEENLYILRQDFYDKLAEETSESKLMIQKEKENLKEEIENLARASMNLMEKDKEESTGKILEEVSKLKRSIEINNREIQQRIKEIEERRKAEEFLKEHQKKEIPRSKELGIKPRFLEKIEHLDDWKNPVSVKEINIISPYGLEQQKKKKETRREPSFNLKEEISELPPMPVSEEEFKFSLPVFNRQNLNFISNVQKPEKPAEIKRTEFTDIKNEVANMAPSLPLKRENKLVFKIRAEENEEKEIKGAKEAKPRKLKVPNRKFLEKERYNIFVDNLADLKNLSFFDDESFENIKPLKEFHKNEAEKSLENCEIIAKNLLKIRTQILSRVK